MSSDLLDSVHNDLWVPISIPEVGGEKTRTLEYLGFTCFNEKDRKVITRRDSGYIDSKEIHFNINLIRVI